MLYKSSRIMPIPAISLEQAITNVIESLAIEGFALSGILKSEEEIILKTKKISNNMEDFVLVNESVNSIIRSVFRLQMLMQFELENTEELLKKLGAFYDNDELEE